VEFPVCPDCLDLLVEMDILVKKEIEEILDQQ
jgi:hypothetical protein